MTEKRLRGSIYSGERRAQLMRGRGDEVGLQLLELAALRHVAEGIDRPAEKLDARDRDPPLSVLYLDRDHHFGVARNG